MFLLGRHRLGQELLVVVPCETFLDSSAQAARDSQGCPCATVGSRWTWGLPKPAGNRRSPRGTALRYKLAIAGYHHLSCNGELVKIPRVQEPPESNRPQAACCTDAWLAMPARLSIQSLTSLQSLGPRIHPPYEPHA